MKFALGGAWNNIRNASATKMTINGTTGLVRIGSSTSVPTDLLQVNGGIRATKVTVNATGWADHVFAPDYQLPTLPEVAAHIAAKKHLPGVPSEAEIMKKGLSVDEMLTTHMAKIEELTLYAIKQHNKAESAEAKLAATQAELTATKAEQVATKAALEAEQKARAADQAAILRRLVALEAQIAH